MGIVFKCLSEGAVDFLVKPIRKNELKNLWQHVWRRCHSVSCYYLPLISDLFHQQRFMVIMVIFTTSITFILVHCCLCVWDSIILCYFSGLFHKNFQFTSLAVVVAEVTLAHKLKNLPSRRVLIIQITIVGVMTGITIEALV